MLWFLISIIIGLVLLVWSADRFLTGAVVIAKLLGMSPLLIGLTIVSLGTSGPEIVVATIASLNGTPGIAIGNAIGSNIANIGMVLGVTALFRVLPFPQSVLKSELFWLIVATVLAFLCVVDSSLSRLNSLVLIGGLIVIFWRIAKRAHQPGEDAAGTTEKPDESPAISAPVASWLFFSGLVVLLFSAEVLVWSASAVAAELGVSDLMIGLTIVAIGTSLPELAATLGGALKGQTGLAIGNVVGSNILNLLAVLAIPGLISPAELPLEVLRRDFFAMSVLTLLLVLFAYGFSPKPSITRFEGAILFIVWIAYNSLLYYHSSQLP